MRNNLPALPTRAALEPVQTRAVAQRGGRAQRWLRSPLGSVVADLTPELLRYLTRSMRARGSAAVPGGLPSAGANGLSISEVEIDVASPFVRRIVVRSTNAWSMAPEVLLEQERRKRKGRLGLGAVSLAGLAVVGFAAVRRVPLSLPSRVRE